MAIFDHLWSFFGNYTVIFYKTEIQTVIKSTKAQKMQKTQTSVFVQNWKKKEMKICAFWVITFEPIISKTC